MNCSRFEILLTDYLDGMLDQRLRDAVARHMGGCERCSDLLREVGLLQKELFDFPDLRPPDELVDRILERTSGKPVTRSFWGDLVVPTASPFLTQRYAFATVIMFVFLSLMVNLWGPGVSALSATDLRPSVIVADSHRFSNQIYKNWILVKDFRVRLFEEARLLKEDLYSRLDYYLISLLFESYSESLQKRQDPQRTEAEALPGE